MKQEKTIITFKINSLNMKEYNFLLDKFYKNESIEVFVIDLSIELPSQDKETINASAILMVS